MTPKKYSKFLIKFLGISDNSGHFSFVFKKGGGADFFLGCNLILLVTYGRMQNFKTLAQSLLGELR